MIPRRLLLIRNDRLGDLILTLPAVEYARQAFPHTAITLLAWSGNGPLLRDYPHVDRVWLDEGAEPASALAERLRPEGFDAAVVLNTNTRNCVAVWRAGQGNGALYWFNDWNDFKAKKKELDGSQQLVDFELDLGVKTIRYTLRHVEERPRRVSWSLVASDWMKVSNGSWELVPDGAQTRARYTVEIQVAKPALIPQALVDRVTDQLTRVQLPRTLEAFKGRAERG